MRKTFILCGLSIAAGTLLGISSPPDPAEAGTAVRLEVEGLVDHAGLIVEGVVTNTHVLDYTSEGRIETEYVLDVERTFWGDAAGAESIRLPGGVLPDGSGMMVPGIPQIATGERVVLFLTEPSTSGMRMPVGLAQGKFRIVSSPTKGTYAVGAHGPMRTVDPMTGEVHVAGAPAVLQYADLVARIEAAAAARELRPSLPESEGK